MMATYAEEMILVWFVFNSKMLFIFFSYHLQNMRCNNKTSIDQFTIKMNSFVDQIFEKLMFQGFGWEWGGKLALVSL